MSEEEKVELGASRKEVGSKLFRTGRIMSALGRYKSVLDLFQHVDNYNEENKAKAQDLKKTCQLNSASCHLKLKDYAEAMKSCDTILKDDSTNVKALFRH